MIQVVSNWFFILGETLKQLAKKITILFKEKGATEDKRVITKLKTQFETELNIFKTTTQQIEAKEKQILISMSVQGLTFCEVKCLC